MIVLLPFGCILQRRLSVLPLVVFQFGKDQRQFVIIQNMDLSVLGMYHGNGLAPVTLTCEDPFTEVIVNASLGNAHFLQFYGDGFLGFLYGHSGKLFGIDQFKALAEVVVFLQCMLTYVLMTCFVGAVDNLDHVDIVCDRILKVTLVVGRNSHNRTGSVACKYEVADEKLSFFAVYGVDAGYTL